MENDTFNYKDKSGVKLTEDFKKKFTVPIKGKEAIKLEGLTAIAHSKGIWKFETEIIQFPNGQNDWTAICKTTIGGYDWDPIEEKVVRVEYSDIGDANVKNCGKMVAASYIRMASTRSQARALRKYTNIDMVCSSELSEVMDTPPEPLISHEQLILIKELIHKKKITQEVFSNILFQTFGHTNYTNLTESNGNVLISIIENYVPINTQEQNTSSE